MEGGEGSFDESKCNAEQRLGNRVKVAQECRWVGMFSGRMEKRKRSQKAGAVQRRGNITTAQVEFGLETWWPGSCFGASRVNNTNNWPGNSATAETASHFPSTRSSRYPNQVKLCTGAILTDSGTLRLFARREVNLKVKFLYKHSMCLHHCDGCSCFPFLGLNLVYPSTIQPPTLFQHTHLMPCMLCANELPPHQCLIPASWAQTSFRVSWPLASCYSQQLLMCPPAFPESIRSHLTASGRTI